MAKNKSAAELYRSQKAERPTIEVVAPSGFSFRFHKPSPLKFVLSGGLPTGVSAEMSKKGVKASADKVNEDDLIETLIKMRDLLLDLSVEPKLVMGEASNTEELSVDEVDDEDLTYLINWVASGGVASENLANFRKGPSPDAVAESYREKLREETERTAGDAE